MKNTEEQPDAEMHRGRYMGRDTKFHALFGRAALHGLSNPETLNLEAWNFDGSFIPWT